MGQKLFLYVLAIVAFIVLAVLAVVDKTISVDDLFAILGVGLALFVGGHISAPVQ